MTNKSACKRYFNELYHKNGGGNPNHDPKTGRFIKSSGGGVAPNRDAATIMTDSASAFPDSELVVVDNKRLENDIKEQVLPEVKPAILKNRDDPDIERKAVERVKDVMKETPHLTRGGDTVTPEFVDYVKTNQDELFRGLSHSGNRIPAQQKRFDNLYELYHFNPFHDKMGRFASSSRGARSYVNSFGRPTDKARRRLKFAEYEPPESDGSGAKKKDKKKDVIQLDQYGRIAEKDQDKAIHEIEKQISSDWSNRSKVFNDSSRLVNDLGRMVSRNRDRTAKAKAAAEDLSSMSNEELKRYVDQRTERMNLERKYREIKEAEYNRGRAKMDDMLETAGTVLALAGTAATIAATIHTLRS